MPKKKATMSFWSFALSFSHTALASYKYHCRSVVSEIELLFGEDCYILPVVQYIESGERLLPLSVCTIKSALGKKEVTACARWARRVRRTRRIRKNRKAHKCTRVLHAHTLGYTSVLRWQQLYCTLIYIYIYSAVIPPKKEAPRAYARKRQKRRWSPRFRSARTSTFQLPPLF